MKSSPTARKGRERVATELAEEIVLGNEVKRRTKTSKLSNETTLKLREDAALLKTMLVEHKEKRNKSSKSRKPRTNLVPVTNPLVWIEGKAPSGDSHALRPAEHRDEAMLVIGPYEDNEDELRKRRKKKRSRIVNKGEQKKENKKSLTRSSKKAEQGAEGERSPAPRTTKQSTKAKRNRRNHLRGEAISSTFYASQHSHLHPQSEEQPTVPSRRSLANSLRQNSNGDSEISDLTSDSKAFEKAMQLIENMRQSSGGGPSSIGSKNTRVSSISSDVSCDADALDIARQAVVDSDKTRQLSGTAAVWVEFDKFQSMGDQPDMRVTNEAFPTREAFDDGFLISQPAINSISELDKWEPFTDATGHAHTTTSSEEDQFLLDKWQEFYENGYSKEAQTLVDEMIDDTKRRESVRTMESSEFIAENVGIGDSTEVRPLANESDTACRNMYHSSRGRPRGALTAPRSSFRQQTDNRDIVDEPPHELLARYIQSLGTDPQIARNVARSFALSQSGRGAISRSNADHGEAYLEGDREMALSFGLGMQRTASDPPNVPSGGTQRHRHRIVWPRFETPGAVQMHTRAFGAPIRETLHQSHHIEEGSTNQESSPSTVMLEARAVSDVETESHGTRSTMPPVVYAEKLSFTSWIRHHRPIRFIMLFLVLTVVAVLASVLAVRLAKDDSPSGSTSGASPTAAPTFVSREFIQELESVSGYEALALEGSPQRRAIGWLSSVDQSDMEPTDVGLLQRYVLVVLYFATGGEHWIERENWLSPTLHECQWSSAISCKTDPSRRQLVTGLDLSRHGLTGQLPPETGYLSQVDQFIVAKNSLNGTLPPSLFNMTRLAVLDVHSNDLEGSIPASVSNAPFIVDLDLSKNLFSGEIPEALYDLSILRSLDVSVNQLTGILASGLGKLRVLTNFNIRSNLITGIIPDTFDLLPNLGVVNLDNNMLTGNIPEWTAVLVQRQELTVSYDLLTGTIPGAPEGGLAALGGVTPDSFRLNKVDISNNRLRGTIPVEVAFIPSLRYIDFSNNRQLRGPFPSFPGVGLWQSIEYLAAANCALTGTVPSSFAPTLTHYIFHGNRLRDGFPLALCDLPELEYLSLAFNDIGGQIPSPVGSMDSLEALDLRACGLTGTIPNLEAMTSLASIDLAENSLGGPMSSEIGMLRAMTEFIAHSNQLTGQIPTEIGLLTNMVVLDIRENTMTGALPTELGRLTDLDQCLLSNNYFQGSVPESLCYILDDLRSVDIGCQLDCGCCSEDPELCASNPPKAPPANGTIVRGISY